MSYQSRAYDMADEGFGPDPVVVLVIKGTHDVSRFVNLLAGGPPVVEQLELGGRIRSQVRRHRGGRAALDLLHRHGGPDFTTEIPDGANGAPLGVDILRLAADGLAIKAIATKLNKAKGSVANELSRLYRTIGARNLTHAVSIGYQRGWIGRSR